jgi:cytochrome d ubiquinol oxidase subunit II
MNIFWFGIVSLLVAAHAATGPLWERNWRRTFEAFSIVLALLYGAALGSVIRGVPLDRGNGPALLDWLTVLCGVTCLIVLALHRSLWVACKTEGDSRASCRRQAARLWWAVVVACGALMAVSIAVQRHADPGVEGNPWLLGVAVIALAGLLAIPLCLHERYELGAFAGSAVMIVGLLCCAAAGQPSLWGR